MVADITSAVNGIITAITSIISPAGSGDSAVAYVALLALPILGGTVAFARRLVKKSR